ncbi:MAG: hypothetical protein GC190_20420 [Alphaproteobacteria bacterium]|nr:hypothetical protein [Alphaproteobacteria bacterium]
MTKTAFEPTPSAAVLLFLKYADKGPIIVGPALMYGDDDHWAFVAICSDGAGDVQVISVRVPARNALEADVFRASFLGNLLGQKIARVTVHDCGTEIDLCQQGVAAYPTEKMRKLHRSLMN